MRLIDADALNAAMYHEAFETDSKDQKWDSGCWIRYKMFERNIKAAPTIPTGDNWISVKTKLPTYAELHDEEVLVLFEGGCMANVRFDECMEPDEYFGYWKQYRDPETLGITDSDWIALPYVTHWMPKPSLPQIES